MSGKQIGFVLLLLLALGVSFPWWGRRLPIGDGVSLSDYIGQPAAPGAPGAATQQLPASGAVTAAAPVRRDDMPTMWSVTEGTDKLTDAAVLNATARTAVGEFVYEFTATCKAEGRRMQIAAFLLGNAQSVPIARDMEKAMGGILVSSDPSLTARTLPWSFDDGGRLFRRFRFRVDSEPAQQLTLRQTEYGNAGSVVKLPSEYDPPPDFFARYVEGTDGRRVEESRLPEQRLLVADVFPDEQVEFSFAALTTEQRARLASACIR